MNEIKFNLSISVLTDNLNFAVNGSSGVGKYSMDITVKKHLCHSFPHIILTAHIFK